MRPRLAFALALAACRTAPPAGPVDAAAQLVVPDARLYHEVALTIPERGEETLLGVLTFSTPESFTLRAETPLGIRVFEVGHDGDRLWAKVAPPLEGRFPAEGLARDVWRIYFAGCPEGPRERRCRRRSAEIVERWAGSPPRVVERRIEEPGRVTRIRYADWGLEGGVLHPRRIVLESGGFSVRIVVTGIERL